MKEWNLRGITQEAVPTARPVVDVIDDPLRLVVDQVPALFWTTDRGLRITASLGAALAELGLGPNQLIGATLSELFYTADPLVEAIAAHRRALLGRPTAFELILGSLRFDARVAPLHDTRGEIIGTVCVAIAQSEAPVPVEAGAKAGSAA